MILIGLSGKKQSGKDTVANLLMKIATPTYNYYRLGFADALYREVAIMLLKNEGKHPTDSLISQRIKLILADKPRYRMLLQWYGTEYRRTINDRYWVDRWLEKTLSITDNASKPILLVCTDVRFTNEYDCIKACGGFVWRIERDGLLNNNADKHPSECELDNHSFTHLIKNNFDLTKLEEITRDLLKITIREHNNKLCKLPQS